MATSRPLEMPKSEPLMIHNNYDINGFNHGPDPASVHDSLADFDFDFPSSFSNNNHVFDKSVSPHYKTDFFQFKIEFSCPRNDGSRKYDVGQLGRLQSWIYAKRDRILAT